jgi:hypothetical protein
MPKRQAEESGGEDVTSPQLKKAKASKSKSAKPKPVVTKKSGETVKDADGNPYWEVGFFLSSPLPHTTPLC